ncbi:hypothetical protein F5878DRAFT_658195 [Lentinula raphanica]|uniref:Tom7-domain-containing protein n=1 Tax=Lentinula raphanica TaxID=153919 RepID=A0AA38PFP1_9AGAR|nr:hypothetical protein F5880DRAFT_1123530 [Lentinula raphanica]KAJ3841813.1 hypothetical protein F5878DRAFT_658195 [Lentinula raphanica]
MPSEDTKERIAKVVDVGRVRAPVALERTTPHETSAILLAQTILHYAWIPMIIYVGFTRSNPQPSLIKLISPLA